MLIEGIICLFVLCVISGCPEAVKVLVGNKSDLTPEVEISQIKVHVIYNNTKDKCFNYNTAPAREACIKIKALAELVSIHIVGPKHGN